MNDGRHGVLASLGWVCQLNGQDLNILDMVAGTSFGVVESLIALLYSLEVEW